MAGGALSVQSSLVIQATLLTAARLSAADICQSSPRGNGSAALASRNQMPDPTRKPCAPKRSKPNADTGLPAPRPGSQTARSQTFALSGQNRARIKAGSGDLSLNAECLVSRHRRFRKSSHCGPRQPAWMALRCQKRTSCRAQSG
jgi:hypothetical protein